MKPEKTPILIEVPNELLAAMEEGKRIEDTDRAKFVRNAIREKLARLGVPHDLSATAHGFTRPAVRATA